MFEEDMVDQRRQDRDTDVSKSTDTKVDVDGGDRTKQAQRDIAQRTANPIPATTNDPVAVVLAEREAGRGDSADAVGALRFLAGGISDAMACIALARIESRLVLGQVQQPLHFHLWAAQLRGLPAQSRAREGYDKLLRDEGVKKSFDRCIAELLEMRDDSSAIEVSLDVVRKYRAAGLGADPRLVDELVVLNKKFGFSLAMIEAMLGGPRADTDDDLLERLETQSPVDYSAYLQARGRIEPPDRNKPKANTKQTKPSTDTTADTTKRVDSAPRTTASGGAGGAAGGLMGPFAIAAANFEGVADEDLNLRMAELLLRAAGAEPQLAAWLARYPGPVPPTKLYGMTPDLADSYGQFRIFEQGVVMPGAAIRAYIDAHGYIDPTLDAVFWKTNVQPLLCNETVIAASQAELMAGQYDKQIAELQKLVSEKGATGFLDDIKALQANAAAYRELAKKLQTKGTTYAEQRQLMERDLVAIDKLINEARRDLAQAEQVAASEQPTDLVADYAEWQRRHPGIPYRPPEQGPGTKAKFALQSQIIELEDRKRVTTVVLSSPGMVMPGAGKMAELKPQASVGASQRNQFEQQADQATQTITSLTTDDQFSQGAAATTNRALVALLHLKGRADAFSAGAMRLIGDFAGLVLPDSMTQPIYDVSLQMKQSSLAFSQAQTTVTGEDVRTQIVAKQLNWEIPVLDRVFKISTLIEAPDQVLFTIVGAIPVAKAPGLAIQGGIVGFQTLETFFRTYGQGGTVGQAINAAGLTAIQGAAATLMSTFKLPTAVAGNLAIIYMFAKIQGLSDEEIEDQIAITLITIGVTVGAAKVATKPRFTGLRDKSSQTLDAMQKADKNPNLDDGPRDADPVRDAKIDRAAEQYRGALDELAVVSGKLEQARATQNRDATIDLSKQLGAVSQKAKQARDLLKSVMTRKPDGDVIATTPNKPVPQVDEGGFQVDKTNERVDSENGWFLDKSGNEVNGKGQRVDADGMVLRLDGTGKPIAGQYLDSDGRAIDITGRYIDDAGTVLTDAQIEERYRSVDRPSDAKLADGTPIELTGRELSGASGGTAHIWEASIGGVKVVIKSPMGKPDAGLAGTDLAVAQKLESLGGPRVLGTATFKRNNKVFTGVVMELVPGIDLARVLAGVDPPFAITKEHLRALESFRDAASTQKLKLYDVNPGDFILTQDGRIVPIDIGFESRPQRTTNPELDRTITKFRDWLGGDKSPVIESSTKAPVPPPPEMADLVVSGIAKTGEAWGNNAYEGSCAHVAMRNAVAAKIAGRDSYIINVVGLTNVGQMLTRFGIDPTGRIAKALTKLGLPTRGGHAIAAVRGEDGVWRYVSWGRVEIEWSTYTKEVWGPTGEITGVFQLDQYVQWMLDNPQLHNEPRGTSPTLEKVSREARQQREEAAKSDRANLGWIAEKP